MFPWNFHNMSIIFESDVKVCSCIDFNITSNKNKISISNQIKWKKFVSKFNKEIKLKNKTNFDCTAFKKNNSSYGHLKSHQLFTNGSSGCLVSPTTLMTSVLSSEGITKDEIGSEMGEASLLSTTASWVSKRAFKWEFLNRATNSRPYSFL